MALANTTWRAPLIHGELQKLGILISEHSVSRVLRTVKGPPSQTWKAFLRNHLSEIIAVDFFTVPTIGFPVLFVFLVLEHQRRRVLHFGVTEHPTAEWTGQQVIEAFSERDARRYLLRDRDSIYGSEFRGRGSGSGHERSRHRTPKSLAECVCGTADRFDSTGMLGSRGGSIGTTPTAHADALLGLLSRLLNASCAS